MSILENITSPEDIKKLNTDEMNALAREIREFLVDSVSKTGGHLASNLGDTEIILAIHKVFDTSRDRLVFDVGHQCYVHKILTGRKDMFDTLRKTDGLAGFPKPKESVHDAFIAGHASNSVSVALGMARARTLKGEDYSVIAILGDGALTGGLAYEGLSDAGDSEEPIIVILNDNGMAIGSNVGGIAKYLAHQRLEPGYMKFKRAYRRFMELTALGRWLYKIIHAVKTAVKEAIFHCSMFEEMGFQYMGPVDGHDINMMAYVLERARELKKPVLIHAITRKGNGYAPAERDPDLYHGVSPFDPKEGVIVSENVDFSAVFGKTLCDMAEKDRRICAVTAAMEIGTGLSDFQRRHPNRFFDVGIAEGHAVSMCAGLAKEGMTPVFAVYSTFLQRAYDMLLHDTAIMNLHTVFCVDRAGLVGADGETHNGTFDIPYLTSIPNMVIYSPSSFKELEKMLRAAIEDERGPVCVRYPRGGEGTYKDCAQGDFTVIKDGADFTLITYGIMVNEAIKAAEMLEKDNVSVQIIKLNRVYPINYGDVLKTVKAPHAAVIEDCSASGCIGEKLAAAAAQGGYGFKSFTCKNTGYDFVQHGSVCDLYRKCAIDGRSIAQCAFEMLGKKTEKADGKTAT